MKTTGVVRRIDDLGRIVIPKEIRKTLRIKDGENLEIFLERDNIVLKKYSIMENLGDFYKKYIDSINSEINKNIIVIDRDKIVAVSGNIKKEYINKNISHTLEEKIKNTIPIYSKEINKIAILNNSEILASYSLSPIFVNGEVIGAVMIFLENEEITSNDNTICLIASKFLGKYLEQ